MNELRDYHRLLKDWRFHVLWVNFVLTLNVVEVVYRPVWYKANELSFARVGYVSDTSVRLLVREPGHGFLPLTVRCGEAGVPSNLWKFSELIHNVTRETDYTATITIRPLLPSRLYQYQISNNRRGSFKTAPPIGQVPPGDGRFTFLTSSCLKPRFPYNPLSHPRSIQGLKDLAKWIPSLRASFMLFLGDFIYIDVPRRHGTDVATYRQEYRQVYSSPDWPGVSDALPWIHVIDDHEIANDWDRGLDPPYPSAIDPWGIYHASVNPPKVFSNSSYFQFTSGPAAFFMMDTRRYRNPSGSSPADALNKTMLGPTQLAALLRFLDRKEAIGVKWKFVVSSIPFTRNWRINSIDTWAGYLHERQIILEAMWDVSLQKNGVGVVVLSGDRHEFAATAFPPPVHGRWLESATIHEFSTSPLSMFYLPFQSYWEVESDEPLERCIKYIPDGNSKFGVIELENVKGDDQGLMRFRLFVDGMDTWTHIIRSPLPVVGKSV